MASVRRVWGGAVGTAVHQRALLRLSSCSFSSRRRPCQNVPRRPASNPSELATLQRPNPNCCEDTSVPLRGNPAVWGGARMHYWAWMPTAGRWTARQMSRRRQVCWTSTYCWRENSASKAWLLSSMKTVSLTRRRAVSLTLEMPLPLRGLNVQSRAALDQGHKYVVCGSLRPPTVWLWSWNWKSVPQATPACLN